MDELGADKMHCLQEIAFKSQCKSWFSTALAKCIGVKSLFIRKIRLANARAHAWCMQAWYRIVRKAPRYGIVSFVLFVILMLVVSSYWYPELQKVVSRHLASDEALNRFRSLALTIGGALIGAAAIAFSLVMFAIQVNVERMPHGLFRKISSDRKLLFSFLATFVLAIGVCSLSMIPGPSWLAVAVLGVAWGTFLILILFLFAFRRALNLINPIEQLTFVIEAVRKDLRRWSRRAQRIAPLLMQGMTENDQASNLETTRDVSRIAYFSLNSHWINEARQALLYAVTFSRRYAEQGDHEVSAAALTAVVRINEAYVEAKGVTFFSYNPFFDVGGSTDQFVNETLEHLRQNVQIALKRGDEQQVEQSLNAMVLLVQLYLQINYSDPYASKTHAHLASGYLTNSAESILSHQMTDVLMEWTRLVGKVANLFVDGADPSDTAVLTEKIGVVAGVCSTSEKLRPVTMEGVNQLSYVTMALLLTEKRDPKFALDELRGDLKLVAKLLLGLPDAPFFGVHSRFLGPYYSVTSADSLLSRLRDLGNFLLKAQKDDVRAKQVIRNVERWADGLYEVQKEIFQLAIEKRSHFVFDLSRWITHVADILLALSYSAACPRHASNELRRHASWLLGALSWIPDDRDAIALLESFHLTETLFDAALNAHRRGCGEVADEVEDQLLVWAFNSGKHQSGWSALRSSMCALATLSVIRGSAHDLQLVGKIQKYLSHDAHLDQEVLDTGGRNLREASMKLGQDRFTVNSIEHAMQSVDQSQLSKLLIEIADVLSPGTAGEPVETDPFY